MSRPAKPLFPYMLESRAMLSAGIGWTRTVVYGLTAEIAVIPLFGLTYWALGAKPAQYSTMPFSFLVVFVFAYMTASTRTSRPVLQGFLVGVVAFASYFAIGFIGRLVMMYAGVTPTEQVDLAEAPPYIYAIAHALKLLGGAAGGWVAAQRSQASEQS